MAKKNKIEEMLDQITQILNFVDANAGKLISKDNVTPAMLDKLAKLEKQVEQFAKMSDKVVELSKVAKENIEVCLKELQELEELTNEAQKIMKMADPNSLEARTRQQEAEKRMEELSKSAPPEYQKVLEKADEVKARAHDMLHSIAPTAKIEEPTSYDAPASLSEEQQEKENEALRRRRRRMRKIGPDRV